MMLINPYVFGRLWTPAQITTALWLDATDDSTITASSGLVSQINDKSGNGRNFTASSTARPTLTSNGLNGSNVLTFGGSQYLTSSNTAATWGFLNKAGGSEVLIVCKAGNTSNPDTLYIFMGSNGGTVNNEGILYFYDDRSASARNDKVIFLAKNNASSGSGFYADISPDNILAANIAALVGVSLDLGNSIASSKIQHYVNGSAITASNTETTPTSTSNPAFTLQIGAHGNNGSPLVGYIAECVICPSKQSTTNRQLIEGYLAHKWGLTANLPSNHPYKSSPPTI